MEINNTGQGWRETLPSPAMAGKFRTEKAVVVRPDWLQEEGCRRRMQEEGRREEGRGEGTADISSVVR